ncbi:hypothetical protein VQ042_19595 [Aurantimonas sp. A2-1-M11]|uniref:hypothetical protein n=1 Tax=Aurantimonas sp. A2-1-M11 TaxID=3113712 RepID=UPI002F9509F7
MSSRFLRFAFVAILGAFAAGCTSNSAGTMTAGAPVQSTAALAPTAFAPPVEQSGAAQQLSKPYFIDFRSRNALSYGHTFVVFGKLDQNGRVPTDSRGVLIPGVTEVAGLHPASTSNVPYTIGHVLPVPAETGPSDGDTEIAYMTANYRIDLTEQEYRDVVGYIRGLQESSTVWHAVLYNCSSFVSDIAEHMGLKAPNHMLFPKEYITSLKEMNS